MKEGTDFYPFPTIYSTALSMILVEFGVAGLGVYAMIGSKIFSESGYFMEANEDAVMLLKRACGMSISDDTVERVIKACVKREIFDKDKYERYGILTSEKVQRDYLIAVRRRKKLELVGNYILDKSLEDIVDLMKDKEDKIIKINFLKDNGERDEAVERVKEVLQKVKSNVSEKRKKVEESGEDSGNVSKENENVDKEGECVDKLPSNLDRVEKSIEEYRIEDKSRLEDTHTRERKIEESGGGDVSLSCVGEKNKINKSTLSAEENVVIVQDVGELLYSELSAVEQKQRLRELTQAEVDEFKREFEGKIVKRAMYLVSEDFEMEKMINEIKLSDFLRQSGNLSLSWLLINSEKVLRGDYRTHSKTKAKAESEGSSVAKLLASIQL